MWPVGAQADPLQPLARPLSTGINYTLIQAEYERRRQLAYEGFIVETLASQCR
jgi:hypothetical protein